MKARDVKLRDKRSRFLLAVRQTYIDFFHDHYISSSQVFPLRVTPPPLPPRPPNSSFPAVLHD